jgi:ribose 5-phosphate isomerase A
MGGAFTREKIVARASKASFIVADGTKKVHILGEKGHPVPIEVLPFAIPLIMRRLREIGGNPILREGRDKVGPVITDNGNVIIDTAFGQIAHPAELENMIKSLTGVIESGLFVKMTHVAYIGKTDSVEKLVIR